MPHVAHVHLSLGLHSILLGAQIIVRKYFCGEASRKHHISKHNIEWLGTFAETPTITTHRPHVVSYLNNWETRDRTVSQGGELWLRGVQNAYEKTAERHLPHSRNSRGGGCFEVGFSLTCSEATERACWWRSLHWVTPRFGWPCVRKVVCHLTSASCVLHVGEFSCWLTLPPTSWLSF